MIDFNIDGINYSYTHKNPHEEAKYGLALTYWKNNVKDLVFFLNLINHTYPNRHLIDISVCSSYDVEQEYFDQIKNLSNYVIHCHSDLGHQNGTTSKCNGAIYPLYYHPSIKTITHTDADTIILHHNFFFGNANVLLDSHKLMMTSTVSYEFSHLEGHSYPHAFYGPGTSLERQFGSMFVLNLERLRQTDYWPFKLMGHFEYDRYTQFINCGLSVENDVILLKRMCYTQPAHDYILYSADFHLGVMHSTNYQDEDDKGMDKKDRMLRIMGIDNVW